jgi:hypothetical protein
LNARTPTLEWQVAGACNYDCSYCIQSRRYRRGRPDAAQVDAALRFFGELPGTWEIKCSGGEAFAHPLFLDRIVPGLMHTPHRISVLTNFSASRGDLERFSAMVGARLVVFSASLHLEFAAVDAFVDKATWFTAENPGIRFVVNQVVRPGAEADARRCRDRVHAAGLRWFPQLLKTKTGVAAYEPGALDGLVDPGAGPADANTAPSYRGRLCWAGVDYGTIDKSGDLWSCRTAKRHGEGWLGNVFHGTARLDAMPRRCPWDICPCTVPANRGMIEGILPALVEVE